MLSVVLWPSVDPTKRTGTVDIYKKNDLIYYNDVNIIVKSVYIINIEKNLLISATIIYLTLPETNWLIIFWDI